VLAEAKRRKALEEEQKRKDEELKNAAALEAIGITEDLIKNTQLNDMQELLKVKLSFRTKF
jgi:hypothetical protein